MAEKSTTAAIPRPTDHGGSDIHGRINDHAKKLSEHHDRLSYIEKRMGVHGKVGANADRDQTGLVKGNPAKHDKTKSKNRDLYSRKRHP